MTLAERYNAEARRMFPRGYEDLLVDPELESVSVIHDMVEMRARVLGDIASTVLDNVLRASE